MKLHFLRIAIGVFFVLFTTQIINAQNTFEGDYLGKKLPGLTRELFDQGEVGGKMAFNFSFSPDGQELFFSYRKGTEENPYPWYEIKYMKQIDGVWSKAKTAFFSGKNSDVDITFSPDGKRLFFISDHLFHLCHQRSINHIVNL